MDRYGRSFSGGSGGGHSGSHYNNNNSQYRRYSRSRSRSRERSRRRQTRSRSRERSSHFRHGNSCEQPDLYDILIDDDYKEERNYHQRNNFENRQQQQRQPRRTEDNYNDHHPRREERDQRWRNNHDREDRNYERVDRERERERHRRQSSDENSDESQQYRRHPHDRNNSSQEPQNIIILCGLPRNFTRDFILDSLRQVNLEPAFIRIKKRQSSGSSNDIAFVEFNTVEEAKHWMDINQGTLQLGDQRVSMQYSHKRVNDWQCLKCGVSNFQFRYSCFMCKTQRGESGGAAGDDEGLHEVTYIISKKIMLRNLDILTNEERVLTSLQQLLPDLAKTVSKVLISRDTLTQTSRGFCYLQFETLIDSMNVHNGLMALNPPLTIDDRAVAISYCIDHEDRSVAAKKTPPVPVSNDTQSGSLAAVTPLGAGGSYTMADVPRLAEYSASLYASNPAEQAHYVQYYTDYYIAEINKGNSGDAQLTEENSGAAVALSAIQRKQKKMNNIETTATAAATAAAQAAAVVKATQNVITPKGNDGKTYPTPDVSRYQYDETSGFYYDPSTGLYYDAHSQYYYNNETGAYLYWDQRRSTYILATPASTQAALEETQTEAKDDDLSAKKDKLKDKDPNNKPDKVKVAKKIVKDMEKWAKQLNQKKDYTVVATPQPILGDEGPSTSRAAAQGASAYADVGFSILEKKERAKLSDYMAPPAAAGINKLVNAYGGGSDSEEDQSTVGQSVTGGSGGVVDETDYVDFQKLTCLLCKRAFQSLEILQKHLKMSNLHKENLAKLNQGSGAGSAGDEATGGGLSYRDRAKERRLKYGESDPPPPNRSRERFELEIKKMQNRQKDNQTGAQALPISSNNVGNRLLQKMGWSEGQGLGRKNQGRTQIIEAEARSNNVGLGNKPPMAPGNDYKTYIKKMMKQRYENT